MAAKVCNKLVNFAIDITAGTLGRMGKKRTYEGRHLSKKELTERVSDLFERNAGKALDLKTVFRELSLEKRPQRMLCMEVLRDLLLDDYLSEKPQYTYRLKAESGQQEGVFHRKANGKNTFWPDSGGKSILVAERNSMHAMDGDRVRISMLARRRNHIREAQVTEILERADKSFVGRLECQRGYSFLITEDRTLANDILIPKSRLGGGKDGDKVVVKITEWPSGAKNPIGKVIAVLGKTGDNNTEMNAILAEYGLPYTYPKQVEEAANRIPADIPEEEIGRREDMREVTTFTIDPRDAKDFDDAISIRQMSAGLWEVGVHIADVTYYVKEDSIIDREAKNRATSVYLVDRTVPMLPERLCNEICSLRPDEDKLTYSVIFLLNAKAEVKDWHVARTVTRSNRRFVYEEVQKVLEAHGEASPEDLGLPGDNSEPVNPAYAPAENFATELITLNRMAKELRRRRMDNGAVNFDRFETRFTIDERGVPQSVYFKFAKDANKLVEEFMLLANRTVAESIGKVVTRGKAAGKGVQGKGKNPKTFVYRVHDQPDQNKLMNLADFVTKFGHRLKVGGDRTTMSRNINKLLSDVKNKKEQNVVETITLRSMMKAVYSTVNIGHFGLAFDFYTHFTSPIRRYPDMMVHRLLSRYAEGGRSASREKYEELCDHSSKMEQLAAQAERSSIKYKQVEFMQKHLGEVYDGTISGVTEYGLYVEIDENKCEGMIPLRDLVGDYYEFDEKNYCLWGRRTHTRYSLGDKLRIKVARANLERKQLDFALADDRESR